MQFFIFFVWPLNLNDSNKTKYVNKTTTFSLLCSFHPFNVSEKKKAFFPLQRRNICNGKQQVCVHIALSSKLQKSRSEKRKKNQRPIVAGRWRAMWNRRKKICSCHNLFVLFRCACVCRAQFVHHFTFYICSLFRLFICEQSNDLFFPLFCSKGETKKNVFSLSPMHKIKSELLLFFICNIFNFLSAFPFEALKFYMPARSQTKIMCVFPLP